MGHIWGRQDPGGPHDGPLNLAIWDDNNEIITLKTPLAIVKPMPTVSPSAKMMPSYLYRDFHYEVRRSHGRLIFIMVMLIHIG